VAIVLEQQYHYSSNGGDGDGGAKIDNYMYIPWPKGSVTPGNLLILWQGIADGAGITQPGLGSGWTQAGTAVASTEYASQMLQVFYKVATGSEPAYYILGNPNTAGTQGAMGLMEFSGVGAFGSTVGQNTASASLASATAMPSLSITPQAGDLVLFIGAIGYFWDDGTMQLVGATPSSSVLTNGKVATNPGVRYGGGGSYSYVEAGWVSWGIAPSASAVASSHTLTYRGGGTLKPQTGCQQRALTFRAGA
jgi:hypothetical protein